jgi:hypothetical protein
MIKGHRAWLVFALLQAAVQPTTAANSESILARRYHKGERVDYHMTATNQQGAQTISYEVYASGIVKQDSSGVFDEEIGWHDLTWNHAAVALPPASANFREPLSLDTQYRLSIPDLGQVDPRLIGPITDLLTVYSDLALAARQPGLAHRGDHIYFQHGKANSWADGNYVLTGEDSIDFDITLVELNKSRHIAAVLIKHVPPTRPQIKLPASWMQIPVADTPNNWVMVSRGQNGKFVAQIGKETFDVRLDVDTENGRILSASLDNPVKALQRECSEATLTNCGDPIPVDIHRQVRISALPTPVRP